LFSGFSASFQKSRTLFNGSPIENEAQSKLHFGLALKENSKDGIFPL